MRKHYDFLKARHNPYAKRLKKQLTHRLDEDTLAYFWKLSKETGIPYQTLINLYLRECAARKKRQALQEDAKGSNSASQTGERNQTTSSARRVGISERARGAKAISSLSIFDEPSVNRSESDIPLSPGRTANWPSPR